MAEFVSVYDTKKENIDKTFIRGDIIIVNRKNYILLINMEEKIIFVLYVISVLNFIYVNKN